MEAYNSNNLSLKGFVGLPKIKLSDVINSNIVANLDRKFTIIFENKTYKEKVLYFVQFRFVDFFHVGVDFGFPIITVEQIKGWELSYIYYQANILDDSILIEELTFNNLQIDEYQTLSYYDIDHYSKVNIRLLNEVSIKLEGNVKITIHFRSWEDTAFFQFSKFGFGKLVSNTKLHAMQQHRCMAF
ncbi:MAG: hypothetical protein IPN86_22830 [Saprospiraceae bacterium]|nr:hypothetical protein [Saprospiraceae bacterium]